MIKLYKNTILKLGCCVALIMTVTGCSSNYNNSSARALPSIPEIRSNIPRSNPQTKRVVRKAPAKPRKLKQTAARVKKYSITSSTSTVITQKEVNAVNQERLRMEKKRTVTVDVDPYDSIPDNSSSSSKKLAPLLPNKNPSKSSPAVISLMARARADLAIGQTQSAVSKLERGLRIESQNPNIWHLLAKAHYDQRGYQQAITMAKKSIRYANGNNLITQNWQLIKKAGEKSDDTIALKEALDYFKVNP